MSLPALRRAGIGIPELATVGPAADGVSLYAGQLSAMISHICATDQPNAPSDERDMADTAGPLHLHFTDRLFGRNPEEAADRVIALSARRPVTVTLHDLPQPSDGTDRLPVRAAAYRRVAEAVDALVCNSFHESALLAEFCRPRDIAVPSIIPLPVIRQLPGNTVFRNLPRTSELKAVAVLGYFYPGKGHAEIVDAAARAMLSDPELTDQLTVLALGAPSKGHESDAIAMVAMARSRQVSMSLTGFLPESQLAERCRRIAVPVAAHQHVSASGSVNSWIGYGRRPLVPDTRYFQEMALLRPGCLSLYQPSELSDALVHGLQNPATTWIPSNVSTGPDLKEVAIRYLSFWSESGFR